ncbi:MAG: 6-phosphofructokinase, partial [Erysipelotrichaceae bacterium]
CGDLALFAGISCGAEIVVTQQTGYDEAEVLERLRYLDSIKNKKHSIVIISEKITDVDLLAKKISKVTPFSGRSTVLGHIQRGGSPSAFDRVLATRMGHKAVALLKEGISGHCVGILHNEIVSTPIQEALEITNTSRGELYEMHRELV